MCNAVGYAHSRGVVHHDLKPAHLMVGKHGEVRGMDWGLAEVIGGPDIAAEAGELDPVAKARSGAPVVDDRAAPADIGDVASRASRGLRGGAQLARSGDRHRSPPWNRTSVIGFRAARSPWPGTPA